MLRYLDDWLILASSREEAFWARDQVLSLCQELGIVVNLEKSTLTPSQQLTYLGIRINSQTFWASATPSRIEKFFSIVEEFLSSKVQSAEFWRVLLGHLASLSHLVPNDQLQMRALQLALKSRVGFSRQGGPGSLGSSFSGRSSVVVHEGRLDEGISLALRSPDQMFWSDASNHGWGRRLQTNSSQVFGWRASPLFRSTIASCWPWREVSGLFVLTVFGRPGCRSLLRQHDRGGVSEETRGDLVSGPERRCPVHPELGGAVEYRPDASVCSREEQRGGRCSVSPQPGNRLGVGAPSGGVQLAPRALAGDNLSFCLLTQLPLFCLFCSCVRSHGCGYGCHAPVMGFATGVCLPSLRHDQPGPGEGEGLPKSGAHAHRSLLAPTSVVSGAARATDSDSSSSSLSVGPSASATRQKVPSETAHASSS